MRNPCVIRSPRPTSASRPRRHCLPAAAPTRISASPGVDHQRQRRQACVVRFSWKTRWRQCASCPYTPWRLIPVLRSDEPGWRGVRIRCASREKAVSGLSRGDATALAHALEAARVHWWQRALAAQAGPLRSVHDRLARLADPPSYTTRGAFSDLRRDAEKVAGRFPARWPDRLPMTRNSGC